MSYYETNLSEFDDTHASYIPRNKVTDLFNRINNARNNPGLIKLHCCGMLRSGKSTIARTLSHKINNALNNGSIHIYSIYMDILSMLDMSKIGYHMLTELSDSSSKLRCITDKTDVNFPERVSEIANACPNMIETQHDIDATVECLKKAYELCEQCHIRILFIIDEFQSISRKNPHTQLPYIDEAITNAVFNSNFGFLLIGRTLLSTIKQQIGNDAGVNLFNSYTQDRISGYSDNELECFFVNLHSIVSKFGSSLTANAEEIILDYANRSPYFLALFGSSLEHLLESGFAGIITDDIVLSKELENTIMSYYNSIEDLLKMDGLYSDVIKILRGEGNTVRRERINALIDMGYMNDEYSVIVSRIFNDTHIARDYELALNLSSRVEILLLRMIRSEYPNICGTLTWAEPDEFNRVFLALPIGYRKKLQDIFSQDKYDFAKKYQENKVKIDGTMMLKEKIDFILYYWRYYQVHFTNMGKEYWRSILNNYRQFRNWVVSHPYELYNASEEEMEKYNSLKEENEVYSNSVLDLYEELTNFITEGDLWI